MTANSKGMALQLFFIDGNPEGMLTAEVFNWTGHILMTPRTQINEALKRKEAGFTGVYILIGEKDGQAHAYIGESDNIKDRINQHVKNKEWWETVVLITSAPNNLNKAHVRYLESRLIEETRSIGKIKLENETTPDPTGLSEADQATMESFLDFTLTVLPAIRLDFLLKKTRPEIPIVESEIPTFEIFKERSGLNAIAKLENGEFIVQKGSFTTKKWLQEGYEHYAPARVFQQLVERGVLVEDGDLRRFTENYAFTSPSSAASVVIGRPSSGPDEWKVKGHPKITYKKWEAKRLEKGKATK